MLKKYTYFEAHGKYLTVILSVVYYFALVKML